MRLGTFLSAGTVAAMADIGSRDTVPGANDNGTAVVSLIALAKRFLAEPTQKTRVILLSAGSEESFSEGIKAFGERHFDSLPRESTFFLCMDSTGSPHLNVLRGEGFLKMWEYPQPALDLIDGLAEELGIWLFPEPAPPQRHRRPRAPRRRLPHGRAVLMHGPQAAGQLPLAQRRGGERELRDGGGRGAAGGGGHPPARRPLAL